MENKLKFWLPQRERESVRACVCAEGAHAYKL
jgi:hypothetical protein